jgi:hypothetical protein
MPKEQGVDPRTNELITEVRFKPNPRVLDHRGEWAEALISSLDLPAWQIDDNSVKVANKDATRIVTLGFQNVIAQARDIETKNFFPEFASKAIRTIFTLDGFGPVEVGRIGVRSKFCNYFRGEFSDLVSRSSQRYVMPTKALANVFGRSARLIDIGAPLNFEDEDGFFNTNCGPMNRDQLKQFFVKNEGFPEVGLYFEIDYFSKPQSILRAEVVAESVSRFAVKSWEFNERIRDMVLKG